MKSTWIHIVIALLIGIGVGWLGADKFESHRPWKKGRMMERFSKELHLTPDQAQKVAKIMESTRAKFDTLHDEVRPRMEEIRNSSRQEIRNLLNTDQQKAFDQMNARWEARKKRRNFHHF
jgi:Spy/CpxP family protein refolding chaperone